MQINGKRFNRSALVQVYTGGDTGLSFGSQGADISAIPAIAIRNLQVLRDGATAQYGSDAIAGVMNFGMRNERNGVQVEARIWPILRSWRHQARQRQQPSGRGRSASALARRLIQRRRRILYDTAPAAAPAPDCRYFRRQQSLARSQLPHYPLPVQIWGSSPQHGWKAVINTGVDVTDNSQLYLTVLGAYNKADQSFNYRSPIGATAADPARWMWRHYP